MNRFFILIILIFISCNSDETNNVIYSELDNPVYLDDNGVTVKAKEWAEVGMTGQLNGVTYIVANREILEDMIDEFGNTNHNLNIYCTTKITDMSYLFYSYNSSSTFNQSLDSWDVSNVTDMSNMFDGASNFNRSINVWDVSSVINMSYMFSGAKEFNQEINDWNVANVTNMSSMFANAFSFNNPLNNWDVSSVTDMNRMFRDEALGSEGSMFNQPIANWNVSNVTDMSLMFRNHRKFNQNLVLWNVNNVSECFLFCENTIDWTLSKPNFSNCNDNTGCN